MISRNYTSTATVTRLAIVSESGTATNKKEYVAHLSNVKCHVQAETSDIAKDGGAMFGKDWTMFCAIYDIIEGDRVTIGSDTYKVVGVSSYPALQGPTSHMEITLRQFKS